MRRRYQGGRGSSSGYFLGELPSSPRGSPSLSSCVARRLPCIWALSTNRLNQVLPGALCAIKDLPGVGPRKLKKNNYGESKEIIAQKETYDERELKAEILAKEAWPG